MKSGHLKLDGESIESTLALSFTIWISTTSIINFGHAFSMSINFSISFQFYRISRIHFNKGTQHVQLQKHILLLFNKIYL